jgi:hypothetical protein
VAGQRGGARAGARRAERPKRGVQPRLLLLGLGAVVALAAWGLLVWVAIRFGRSGREGDSGAWLSLAVASLAAVACLFLCLWLVTVLLRAVGLIAEKRPRRH